MIRKAIRRLRRGESDTDSVNPSIVETATQDTPTKKDLPNSPKPVTRFGPQMPSIPLPKSSSEARPRISFVVIIYKMRDQAKNTLRSLHADYQLDVDEEDYEVLVVENTSSELLGEQAATEIAGNIRYFLREEATKTPVHAINFGAAQARGDYVAVIIDGARMVSPGLVNYMLAATQLAKDVVIAVPGYHLGEKVQQEAMLEGYNHETERQLLASINWPEDGYRLFEISCLSGTSSGGVFKPIGESNCVCVSKQTYDALGGYDEGFTETGGGQVNLDFYKRAVELPETLLITLLGEGCFHQFHGGITTGTKGKERQAAMEAHFAQYRALRGGPYEPPEKRSIYLGAVPDAALKFIRSGANNVITVNCLD
ncbi:MAG: glycosyltransferase family 2 protein [Pseudomonadales bacterium]